jgi:hypothetical protein
MPNTHPRMRLSRDEEAFLRQWMYDETHYQEGTGPAKRLQVQHGSVAGAGKASDTFTPSDAKPRRPVRSYRFAPTMQGQ